MKKVSRALVILCLSLVIGCRSKQTSEVGGTGDEPLATLTRLYVASMNANGGQAPANEAEFKKFVAASGDRELQAAGVSSVDELFVSPRDNQPYVIPYGSDAARLIGRGVVAYERRGKDGHRFVGYRLGFVNEIDDAEFRSLVPSP
jgi:hypothetical protein